MFPSAYSWVAVQANITEFLSEPIVVAGTLAAIAVPWVVKLIRMTKKATSAR